MDTEKPTAQKRANTNFCPLLLVLFYLKYCSNAATGAAWPAILRLYVGEFNSTHLIGQAHVAIE